MADKHERVFALLAGQPNDGTWAETIRGACEAIRLAKEKLKFGKRVDRRGPLLLTIAYGVSYGGGQRVSYSASSEACSRCLIPYRSLGTFACRTGTCTCSASCAIIRIFSACQTSPAVSVCSNHHLRHTIDVSGYLPGMFAIYFPELYKEYAETLGELYDADPALREIFAGGVWPALSLNFPPNAYTKLHTDAGNKANGMCPIFSLGDFDPTEGGHLVLPDVKLVVEFPPGSLIFIPSGTLRHGNIPVRPWESRTSWTQYAAGGLFRWMRYGRCSWETLKKTNKSLADAELARRAQAWEEAVASFPSVQSLFDRAAHVTTA